MALADNLSRLAGNAAAAMHQRLELAALDIEEELLRLGSCLLWAMAAVLLATLGLAAVAATVVMHFWDSARMQALFAVIGTFALAAGACWWWLLRCLNNKPALFCATMGELSKDKAGWRERS